MIKLGSKPFHLPMIVISSKLDLVTNGVVIADAIKFVSQKREEVGKMAYDNTNSTRSQTETLNSNLDSVGSTTTNKIF